jgi:hypothetical protein
MLIETNAGTLVNISLVGHIYLAAVQVPGQFVNGFAEYRTQHVVRAEFSDGVFKQVDLFAGTEAECRDYLAQLRNDLLSGGELHVMPERFRPKPEEGGPS